MSGRDAVLGKIRRALGGSADDATRKRAVQARLKSPRPNLIPARGQLPQEERVHLFHKMAEQVSATVTRVGSLEDVPSAVADYLRRHNLPARIRSGADPVLAGLPWSKKAPNIERLIGPSDGQDAVSLSHAFAGVAESGTLVLLSGSDNPTTLNFLPDTHLVVVSTKDIDGDYETVWLKLRKLYGPGKLPRTVNFVTGPSRSADIEQTLILGAHGPRALHILVVG